MDENTSLIEKLKDQDPYVRRDACDLAGSGRCADVIPELVVLLRDTDLSVREASVNALVSIGGSDVAEALPSFLRDDDPVVRNIGVEILSLIGTDALEMLSRLLDDPDDDVVKFCVDILANIEDERAVDMLSPVILHKNPNVRASVAVCLGRIKAKGAAEVLLKGLDDTEEWVKFSAIEGLGFLSDPIALPRLLELIEKDQGLVREAALEAASKIANVKDAEDILCKLETFVKQGHIANAGAVAELLEKASAPGSNFKPSDGFKQTYFKLFSDALEDADRSMNLFALKGCSFLKVPDAITKVFEFADTLKDIDEETEALLVSTVSSIAGHGPLPSQLTAALNKGERNLMIALKVVVDMGSEEAVPALKKLIGQVEMDELREVALALEAIGSPNAIDVLVGALKSKDGHVRKIAARALGASGREDAVDLLAETLKAEVYRDVLEQITDSLANIPSEDVKKVFTGLLTDDKDQLREMGARGLGVIGDETSLTALKEAALDNNADVRKTVYKSMAKLGIPDAADAIINGLRDGDDEVKLAVLKALGGWEGEGIKSALVDALKDNNMWVRYQAILLLGEMQGDDIEAIILEQLLNGEPPVKVSAAKALEKVGTQKAVAVLEQFMDHQDSSVTDAVENALCVLTC